MTDREIIIGILTRAGIAWKVETETIWRVETENDIVVESKQGPNNLGYSGFFAVFSFNPDDSLKSIGVWE